jgi:hypothetical protein
MEFLSEHLTPNMTKMSEIRKGKDLYLSGLFMVGEQQNGNRRVYPKNEIERAVSQANSQLQEGYSIMGELQHPNTMTINLDRVSHIITELRVEGANAYGKMKIVDTPCGMIAKALLDGGAKLGVSSRGTGNLSESGIVSNFVFSTIDIVSVPSGPGCYPDMVYESLQQGKIQSLAEAAVHDAKAQQFLLIELKKFMDSIIRK